MGEAKRRRAAFRAVDQQYLLNKAQSVYLTTRADTQEARAGCMLMTTVFMAWIEGRLQPTNAETTAELQDAAAALYEKAPLLAEMMLSDWQQPGRNRIGRD